MGMIRPLLLLVLAVAVSCALEDPTAKLKAIDAEATTRKAALIRAWIDKADLSEVKVAPLSADPRQSERDAVDAAERANGVLGGLRDFKASADYKDDARTVGAIGRECFLAVLAADQLRANGGAIRKAAPAALAGNR
jgi:hypothetical protein